MKEGGSRDIEGGVGQEAEIREEGRYWATGLEDAGRAHKSRNVRGVQMLESPKETPEGTSPADTVNLA